MHADTLILNYLFKYKLPVSLLKKLFFKVTLFQNSQNLSSLNIKKYINSYN